MGVAYETNLWAKWKLYWVKISKPLLAAGPEDFLTFSDTLLVLFLITIYGERLSLSTNFWLYNGVSFLFVQVFHGIIIPWQIEGQN